MNHKLIRENFINLYESGIKVIHYYRPITPLNSKKEDIIKMLDFVSKYSTTSVICGLKIKEDYFEMIKFWPELSNMKESCLKAEGIWPREAYDFFYNGYNYSQKIYQTNYCALMHTLNKPALSYYGTNECRNCNICSNEQRKMCEYEFKRMKEVSRLDVINQLKKIGYEVEENNIIIDKNIVKISGINLSVGDIAYLTFALKSIIVLEKANSMNYWNSALNGAKPFIV